MPHPDNLVEITTDTDLGAVPRDPFSTLLVLGTASSGSPPPDGFNNATRHTSATSVAGGFGDGSDVHTHAEEAFAEGVNALWRLVLEETTVSETIANSDTTSVSSGTVSDAPMSGTASVTITVDGTDQTVIPVTSSPPTAPSGETLDSGEALYNPDTGEIETADSTSGSG